MKIYTKTGDDGDTGLFNGTRVPKDDLRVEAYGTTDELSSSLGLLRSASLDATTATRLAEIQSDLFEIGSDLATPGSTTTEAFLEQRIGALERWMDELDEALPPLKSFILPGGTREASLCHVARTICRRAERRCWTALRQHAFPRKILVYLNRLSDLLFVLARQLNHGAGADEEAWKPRSK